MEIFSGAACDAALKKIARGDMSGLEVIYDRMGRQIYSLAYSVLGNETEAEDVMQETFLKIMNGIKTYDGGPRASRAWILAIANHLSTDKLRRRRVRAKPYGVQTDAEVCDSYDCVDDRDLIDRLISRLTDEDRQIVILRAVHGIGFREIGAVVGLSDDTTRARYVRALEKMKKEFREEQKK